MVPIDLSRLCRRLGYAFESEAYLKQALTHCSMGPVNNERFEFLGDSILSFVMAHTLFQLFPEQSEGKLSRLRAHLVKGEMLAAIALEIDLGAFLFLGQGELKSGGFRRASILADALEAVLAAIFLDGGIDAVRGVIMRLYASRLNDDQLHDSLKDAKTKLQEWLQAHKKVLPVYNLTHMSGDEHEQLFHITCTITGVKVTTEGAGLSRRKAEQIAAEQMLSYLLNTGY